MKMFILSARGLLDSMSSPNPWALLVAQMVKNLPAMQETRVMRMYVPSVCVLSQITYSILSSLLPWQVGTEDTPSKINPRRYGLWVSVLLGNLCASLCCLTWSHYLLPVGPVCFAFDSCSVDSEANCLTSLFRWKSPSPMAVFPASQLKDKSWRWIWHPR